MAIAENIRLRKRNMVFVEGYFYTFDDDQDNLLQKTDDGTTAFSYPLDTLLSREVFSIEHDGVNFWSLEKGPTEGEDITIKRWKLENYICELKDTFIYESTATDKYSSSAFSIEHYHTQFTTTISGGSNTIYLEEYSDDLEIIEGVRLHLGPNQNGEEEDITVSSTVFGGVVLDSNTSYGYDIGDSIQFYKYIWLFNNYDGIDNTSGALYKLDAHSGSFLAKYRSGAYKDINATTFSKIDSFASLGSKDMLMYIKGTNTLFVNTSSIKETEYSADFADDDFTTISGSNWSYTGNPNITNNTLVFNTQGDQIEALSNYYLTGDFDVTISGAVDGYDPNYSGTAYMSTTIGIKFPSKNNHSCGIERAYNTYSGIHTYQNFNVNSYTFDTHNVINVAPAVVSGTTYTNSTVSGTSYYDNYSFRVKRVGTTVHFYYNTTHSGVTSNWDYLGFKDMYLDNCQLYLKTLSNNPLELTGVYDSLRYSVGTILYTSTSTRLPYFGSMVMENVVQSISVISVEDISIGSNNLYRLQSKNDDGTSFSSYSYQISPLDQFITSISVAASPSIIAANNISTSTITALVKDQFLQPIIGRRVVFSSSSDSAQAPDGLFIGGTEHNTDVKGKAVTIYQAGSLALNVTITALSEQTN